MKKKLSILALTTAALICSACTNTPPPPSQTQSAQQTQAKQTEEKQTTAASDESSSAVTYPVTIKVGYSTSADDPRGVVIAQMKEEIEKGTNGNVLFEIHPSGELGSDAQLIAGLIDGSVDMTVSSAGNYASYATRMGVSALPFLFPDFETAWSFIDSEPIQAVADDLGQFNMHVLAYFDNGFRCVTTTEKTGPVKNVEDMQGLNIRTPDNQIVMETMSALGANPQSFPFAELKEALKNGTFDAQENPIPVIYNNKLYEVQKYLSVTNHSYDAMPLAIRKDLWDSLDPAYRVVIENAAKKAQDENRSLVKKQTEEFVSKLEAEGMVIVNPDLAAFKEATSSVIDVFADIYGEQLTKTVKDFSNK